MTRTPFSGIVEALARLRGVRAAMLVDARDGVAIDAVVRGGDNDDVVAALMASLYRKARRSAEAAGLGATGWMQLEAEDGRACVLGGEDMALIVITAREVNIGVVRVELLRAAERLAQ